jgi:hypothetical protein
MKILCIRAIRAIRGYPYQRLGKKPKIFASREELQRL